MTDHICDATLPRHIYLTSLRLQIQADKGLHPFGITLEQLRPLKVLSEAGGAVGQRQLSEMADKTPANMTRILDRLAAKGLVERQPDPADRRAFTVVLTPDGKEMVAKAESLFSAYLEKVLTGISEQEKKVCRTVLERITTNLADLAAEESRSDEKE